MEFFQSSIFFDFSFIQAEYEDYPWKQDFVCSIFLTSTA